MCTPYPHVSFSKHGGDTRNRFDFNPNGDEVNINEEIEEEDFVQKHDPRRKRSLSVENVSIGEDFKSMISPAPDQLNRPKIFPERPTHLGTGVPAELNGEVIVVACCDESGVVMLKINKGDPQKRVFREREVFSRGETRK